MPDSSFLEWPFFDDSHRQLALQLEAWCLAELSDISRGSDSHGDVEAACKDLVASLAQGGWLKHAAPEGKLDVRTLCLIRETLARHSGLADFSFAMQGLGSGPVGLFGTPEQKRNYLTDVREGKKIAAFALSEPDAGSDVAALSTTATKDGEEYVVNGRKTWISNAGVADFYIVFVRTGEAPGAKGLSALIVDAEAAGLNITENIKVSAPHPLGTLEFNGCRIPATKLISNPGDGFKVAMATLDVFRSTVGAAALGFARRALDEALKRTTQRHLFGAPLSDMQITQAKLADMATAIDASALLIYRAAWTKDNGAARITKEAAMAKLFATEEAQKVIDNAVQLFGGLGVTCGETVEQLYREIRPLRIYEGASEVQQQIIAGQLLKDLAEQEATR